MHVTAYEEWAVLRTSCQHIRFEYLDYAIKTHARCRHGHTTINPEMILVVRRWKEHATNIFEIKNKGKTRGKREGKRRKRTACGFLRWESRLGSVPYEVKERQIFVLYRVLVLRVVYAPCPSLGSGTWMVYPLYINNLFRDKGAFLRIIEGVVADVNSVRDGCVTYVL